MTGPRQTGKTTLIRQVLAQLDRPYHYVAVDEPDSSILPIIPEFTGQPSVGRGGVRDVNWLVRQWERARMAAKRSDRGLVLALDEIQKVPDWSEAVKGLWDTDRFTDCPLHVILSGSAPLLMQQGMGESLAGRFETIPVTHWSFSEMSAAFGFDLQHYIYFGGYPGGVPYIQEQSRWRAYVNTALIEPIIERDILAMQRVDKPALLKQLFQLGAEYSGQILSFNKMLGQLQDAGNTTTLARYLDLLSKAGLITGILKYASQAHRRRSSSPKLNVLNTALMTAASEYSFEAAKADRSQWGRLVESAVGAHLFNTGMPECRLHYWRENGSEVDFVLKRGRKLVGFEVKSGVRRPRTRGLEQFAGRFDGLTAHIVGEGGIPIPEFLSIPATEWLDDK
ncbi:MAG: ATP-binding protein [Rhodobacteraceae bacterium]|nr:ATP-binding protein [Paracoccaceae bacterium]